MTILVTGARGNIGSRVVEGLAAAGHRVRGAGRDPETLTLPPGVDRVALDLNAPQSARDALRDVHTVFLYPTRGEIGEFLAAARSAEVEHIVLLSSPASYEPVEHEGVIGRVHQAVEQALAGSGLPHTVLYPSWLASNARRDWAGQIRDHGRVGLPYPDAQFTPIHLDDVAEVAVDLLSREAFRGRMQILTGPESLRQREIVGILGEVLGHPVPVDELTRKQALAQREPSMPEDVLNALLDVTATAVGLPAPVNNTVERITGHPARTFRAWAQANRSAFRPA